MASKAITYEIGATDSTLTATWIAEKTKMNTILSRASHNLYNAGYGNIYNGEDLVEFSELTTQQKANILLDYFTKTIKDHANTFYVVSDEGGIDEVRETRTAELNGLHEMGV